MALINLSDEVRFWSTYLPQLRHAPMNLTNIARVGRFKIEHAMAPDVLAPLEDNPDTRVTTCRVKRSLVIGYWAPA